MWCPCAALFTAHCNAAAFFSAPFRSLSHVRSPTVSVPRLALQERPHGAGPDLSHDFETALRAYETQRKTASGFGTPKEGADMRPVQVLPWSSLSPGQKGRACGAICAHFARGSGIGAWTFDPGTACPQHTTLHPLQIRNRPDRIRTVGPCEFDFRRLILHRIRVQKLIRMLNTLPP